MTPIPYRVHHDRGTGVQAVEVAPFIGRKLARGFAFAEGGGGIAILLLFEGGSRMMAEACPSPMEGMKALRLKTAESTTPEEVAEIEKLGIDAGEPLREIIGLEFGGMDGNVLRFGADRGLRIGREIDVVRRKSVTRSV